MLQSSVRLALTLAAALLIVPAAGAEDSPAPVQEPAEVAGLEAPTAPGDTLDDARSQECTAPVVAEASVVLSASCETTRCFVDSNCDSFCGGAGFGVCMTGCCYCAG